MSEIKYRNMLTQILLIIVTFGIYLVYWFHQTASELKIVAKDTEAAPTLWTVLLFIPFGNIYSIFKYSELYEKVCSEKINKWLLFVLWFVFSPAIWFLVQSDLNKLAKKQVA